MSILVMAAVCCGSCNQLKDKTKQAINKTGETVGKGASEFFNGVAEGVHQTFQCRVELADSLSVAGLGFGKLKIAGEPGANDNILTVYLIFNNDFSRELSVKVFDESGNEYGRTRLQVDGKKGTAAYADFVFDKRVEIENNSVFRIE